MAEYRTSANGTRFRINNDGSITNLSSSASRGNTSFSSSSGFGNDRSNNNGNPFGNNGYIWAVAIIAFLMFVCVGGYIYYDLVYLPAKIDREAPRYYTFADVLVLRSSQSSGADFNKVASLPFGTELITYEHGSEWSNVKVNSVSSGGEKQIGYVASQYVLPKTDFFLLNSIFGNQNSREIIKTTKCRLALLNYYKRHGYIGKIDEQVRYEAGITTIPNSENQWQVFCKSEDAPTNNVFFKRLYNRNSQFTDFAVIINNINTGYRKLLYFYFDDDESPHLFFEQNAPANRYIDKIFLRNNRIVVNYSD